MRHLTLTVRDAASSINVESDHLAIGEPHGGESEHISLAPGRAVAVGPDLPPLVEGTVQIQICVSDLHGFCGVALAQDDRRAATVP